MIQHLRPFFATIALLLFPTITHAQTYQPTNRPPVADNTLGTQVSGNGNNFNITGGVNKGHTLFHSFTDFSVPTNGQANFLNPVGNRDIITRVTGNVFSDINGLVNTNGANFFLLNPNGIVFGTNARLNVGKAFVGSTANSLDLVDGGGRMMTFGTNVNGDAPLLSVAPNVLFDVSRLNFNGGTGAITNFGTLQTPNNSQYIGLIGGNVTLDGSTGGGKIVAPGGRVDIGGLSGAGSVTVDNNGLVFSSVGVGRSNVLLTDGAGITVRATGTLDTVNTFFNNATSNGSSLNISANNLDLLNAGAISNTLPAAIDAGLETNSGIQTKAAGNINIDAIGKVSLNSSAIKNTLRAGAEGSVGDIKIQAGALDVTNNSIISTVTGGKGNAGNVTVTAKDTVSFAGSSVGIISSVATGGVGNSGSVNINARSLSLKDGAQLAASTFGTGNAGNVTVTAKDAVSLSGQPTTIFSTVEAGGVGKGGTIEINAGSLSLTNGAQLNTITRGASATQPAGMGDAGSIMVKVSGAVDIAGINGTFPSGIRSTVDTKTKGNGGNITIDAGSLSLRDGAQLVASNLGTGNAGNITVTAKDAVSVIGGNIFSTIGTGAIGQGGNISIAGSSVSARDGAVLTASTFGTGNAGNVSVTAKDDVSLTGNSYIFSTVQAGGMGKGGSIEINAGSLSLTNGARLLTSTGSASATQSAGIGDAGDVIVKVSGTVDIAGFGGTFLGGIRSEVRTGAKGNGGNISIGAGSFSLRDGAELATSTLGTGNAGNVTVTAKDAVSLTRYSYILSKVEAGGVGNGGNIAINAGSLSLQDSAKFQASTYGVGNAGNVTVRAKDAVSLSDSSILSTVASQGTGKGGTIDINAGSLSLTDGARLIASTYGTGNAGNIDIKSTGNLTITGTNDSALLQGDKTKSLSSIESITQGKGNAGKITINTQGNLSVVNRGGIFNYVDDTGEGTSQGIRIDAKDVNLANLSKIQSGNYGGKGNSGNVDIIATGNLNITGTNDSALLQGNKTTALSEISSITQGKGDAGKITINTQGNLSVLNRGGIFNYVDDTGEGTSQGIRIDAKDVNLANFSNIQSSNYGGKGNAGNIDITATGNLNITGTNDSALLQGNATKALSGISSITQGKGDAGKVTINTQGNLSIANRAGIFNTIDQTAVGKSQGISIAAKDLSLTNVGTIQSSNDGGTGTAGDIDIKSTGTFNISGADFQSALFQSNLDYLGLSGIFSGTSGKGDTGKITIDTTGDININNHGGIFSQIATSTNPAGDGNSQGIEIKNTRNLTLTNFSNIQSSNLGGKGNAGKITIDTLGKLSLSNEVNILSKIEKNAIGNSEGIDISAGELDLKNNSKINASTYGIGNAGNVEIVTAGKYTADNRSAILAVTASDGNAGNINLNAKSVTLSAGSEILPQSIVGKGKAGNLTITTPRDGFITITGTAPSGILLDGSPGGFSSGLLATTEKDSSSVAGKISLSTGTLTIENGGVLSTRTRTNTAPSQPNSPKSSIVDGKYPQEPGAGSILIDANNINITGGGQILTTSTGNAPAGDVILKNANTKLSISGSDPSYEQRQAALAAAFPNGYAGSTNRNTQELVAFVIDPINQYSGIFANNGLGSTGKGGTIVLNPFSVKIADGGQISVNNQGTGEGGNIFLVSNLVTLNNGKISAESANTTGGNINLTTNDYLLLRNGSGISTNSGSNGKNGNGGNITISSPSIVALPGNNDITANAYNGNGGNVNITSQGLFGIQYRTIGSTLTNDITASSTFGQSGTVNISTPGIDPGRDTTQLPNVTTDASNQISQVCSAGNRQNKLTVAGRGGLPPNANDPLTSDVVWQDARAVNSQPAVSSATPTLPKFAPPAVGWVFDGKGKVLLIAAGTQGQPTGTSVVCPNVAGK